MAVSSWDITKRPGPARGVYFDCYVVIDSFSRHVVAWTVAAAEDSVIAKDLIADAIAQPVACGVPNWCRCAGLVWTRCPT